MTTSPGSTFRPTCWRSPEAASAYGELKQAELGGPLPWPDGHFRAFFSTGVFTISHAPAASLHELVRITRRGGHAIFTVRDIVLESGGFHDVFAELERQRKWRRVEESKWLRAFAISEPEALVKAFVFEIVLSPRDSATCLAVRTRAGGASTRTAQPLVSACSAYSFKSPGNSSGAGSAA